MWSIAFGSSMLLTRCRIDQLSNTQLHFSSAIASRNCCSSSSGALRKRCVTTPDYDCRFAELPLTMASIARLTASSSNFLISYESLSSFTDWKTGSLVASAKRIVNTVDK